MARDDSDIESPAVVWAPLDETIQILFGDQSSATVSMDGRDGEFYSWNPANPLNGSSGSDTLDGGDGFDILYYIDETGVAPNDVSDEQGIIANLTSVTISGLAPGEIAKAAGGFDSTSNFEAINGSQFDDVIFIDTGGFVADRGGDDSVVGGHNGTTFYAGSGDDTYIGGDGLDLLVYDIDALDLADGGSEILDVEGEGSIGIDLELSDQGEGIADDPWGGFDIFTGIDRFYGSAFDDQMEGEDGDDYFSGGDGNDTLRGEEGQDTLIGGAGGDTLDPGDSNDFDLIMPGMGDDFVNFANITAEFASVTLTHLDLSGGLTAVIDGVISNVELYKPGGDTTEILAVQKIMNAGGLTLIGTFHDDNIEVTVSDGGWFALQTSSGNDIVEIEDHDGTLRLDYMAFGVDQGMVIDLSTGDVTNDGFGDRDTLIGSGEISELRATGFSDHITGTDNIYERFILEGGDDTLIAGLGLDELRYDRDGVGALNADLAAGTVTGTWHGEAFTHTISGVEILTSGDGDDTISGLGLDVDLVIQGGGGNDSMTGGIADDYFFDIQGDNTLSGGAGDDDFVLAEGDNEVHGGADFDTIELNDDSSGGVVVDFSAAGGVSLTGLSNFGLTPTQRYQTTTTGIERVTLEVEDDVEVTGGNTNDVVSLITLPESFVFHGGDGTDQLQLHQLRLDGDASLGLSSDEFLSFFEATTDIDGNTEFRLISDGSLAMTLSGIEELRFTDGTDSLSEVLGNLPSTISGSDGNDSRTGTDENEVFLMAGGDDTITTTLEGLDTINGGEGIDTLIVDVTTLTGETDLLFDTTENEVGERDDDDERDVIESIENFTLLGTWNVEAIGGNEANVFVTGEGDDTLIGNGGNDSLADGAGDDSVSAGEGNDTIKSGTGNDTFDGGGGVDTIQLDTTGTAPGSFIAEVNLALNDIGGRGISVRRDVVTNVENVEFTGAISAEIIGDDADNHLSADSGDDTLDGGAGSDTLVGGTGDDSLNGGEGIDRVVIGADLRDGATVALTLTVADGHIEIDSADGTDTVHDDVEEIVFDDETITYADLKDLAEGIVPVVEGTGAGEVLSGTVGDEVINAFGGADWISLAGGNDTIDGGEGRDMLSFSDFGDSPGRAGGQFRISLDMETGISENHDGTERIEFTNIERLTSTIYTDLVRGSDGDDQIRTLGDYDWIVATEGNDTYDGGTGNDMISFLEFEGTGASTPDFWENGALPPQTQDLAGVRVDLSDPTNNTGLAANKTLISIERVTGSSYQDVFIGDDSSNNLRGMGGYDWFVGSDGGRERYFGGNGIDTVTYHVAPDAITASLINGTPNEDGETGFGSQGWARKDLYFSIENLVGSLFDDTLEGSSAKNQLAGLDGDDIIFGLGGNDELKGGLGDDTLNGGAGSDRAIYDFDSSTYTLTRTAAKTVTISHATDGTDSLQDVEYFEFADQVIDVWSLDIV